MITFDVNDSESLSRCIYLEARGEGIAGMRAVANVIVNRVGAKDFPATLHDVIYQKNAFSSMSRPSDPQYGLKPSDGNVSYQQAQVIASAAATNAAPDITYGARYYANLRTMEQGGWFEKNICGNQQDHPHTVTLGQHDFYK